MLFDVISSARDLSRMHEIASVLVRHGLGDVVRRLGIARLLQRTGKVLHWDLAQRIGTREPEQRLREALEDLGPAFVKAGQILAGRSDLLPPAWSAELTRLQQQVPPAPSELVLAQLEQDLGAAPGEVFDEFDPEPMAAASVAQVHRARLADGTAVVLKVRRPGIREVVESDLKLLTRLGELVENRMPELRRYRPRLLVRQFARSLRNELDFRLEARNTERMAVNLAGHTEITIPRVHGRWTCERLVVMDLLEGPSIGEWLRSDEDHSLAPRLAATGADAVLHMVFVDGFFHADPHPGNVLVLPDGRLGLLDFGMVGRLTEARRMEFLQLLLAISERRPEQVVELLMGWSVDGNPDLNVLSVDCADFIEKHSDLPLKELDVTRVLTDVAMILRDNDLYLPEDMALLLKVFVTLDGLGRSLDPDFVMTTHLEPLARQAMLEMRSPLAMLRRSATEMRGLIGGLPRDLRNVLRTVRRGRLHLELHHVQLDRFAVQLDRISTRITIGLVTSALIVGTAIALNVSAGPQSLGLSLFGLLGFLTSLTAGAWLLWSLRRSNRP